MERRSKTTKSILLAHGSTKPLPSPPLCLLPQSRLPWRPPSRTYLAVRPECGQASTRRDPHHTPVKWDYQSLCAGREGVGVRQVVGGLKVEVKGGVSEWKGSEKGLARDEGKE